MADRKPCTGEEEKSDIFELSGYEGSTENEMEITIRVNRDALQQVEAAVFDFKIRAGEEYVPFR